MPLGGLLPYGDERDIGGFDLGSILTGGGSPEVMRPTAAPQPQRPGFGQQLLSMIPQLVSAFGAGQAVRQRNPTALSAILENYMQGVEAKRRTQLAEEAQRLREEREFRLAEQAGARESRLIDAQRLRAEADQASTARQGRVDLSTMTNQISDDARAMFRPGFEGAPLEEYISQQVNRTQGMEGADPAALRALLMSMATGASRPEMMTREVLSPEGAVVRSDQVPKGTQSVRLPRPPQPREAPVPRGYTTTDEEGNIYRVVEDPRTGKEISRSQTGKRPKTGGGAVDRIIAEASKKPGAGGAVSVQAPNGKTYTFKSQAEADAFKKAAGIK